MRFLVGALSVCFLVSSCGEVAKPATVHLEMSGGESEHDEIVYPSGDVIDVYPDHATPHEVIVRKANGGKIDAICLGQNCKDVRLQISGSKVLADGSYQLLQTDDPKLMMVRDSEGTSIIGYLVTNTSGAQFFTDQEDARSGGAQFFPDLQQAQAYEHKGDTARTVGKVVVGVLLVGALVVLVGAAAAADAQADTVTTRCTSWGNSTTCRTY
jgi:hypothetical protein